MGQGNEYRCEECGYSMTAAYGAGMMYPTVYRETIEKGRAGKLGEKLKTFLAEHPEGAVNCGNSMIRCTKCGSIESEQNLSMYLPKDGDPVPEEKGIWSVAMPQEDIAFVCPWDLPGHYRLYARYPHRCSKCGGKARVISERKLDEGVADGTVRCPRCGGRLRSMGMILWD